MSLYVRDGVLPPYTAFRMLSRHIRELYSLPAGEELLTSRKLSGLK